VMRMIVCSLGLLVRTESIKMRALVSLFLFTSWVVGIVLAKGFWSTFFAVIIPLWSYYLVVEHFVVRYI